MIIVQEKNSCAGCTACYSICSKNAIKMREDTMGFNYPEVDLDLCVNCGLCERVCLFRNKITLNEPLLIYAARNKDLNEVNSSRSGAVFPEIASYVIDNGGIVYGAVFNENLDVVHAGKSTKEGCISFKGSKYVQSKLEDTYKKILDDLKQGRMVLFSGTPCQVYGLKNIIPDKLINYLYTVDIICHGVPSPFIYRDYITYEENKHKSKIIHFNFRDKTINGWHDHKESFCLLNGQKKVENLYTKLFYSNCFFRESCYKCPFANISRASDITLGDFWGWEKVDSFINQDDKGVSLVFINTGKGQRVFNNIKDKFDLRESNKVDCLQRNLQHPTPMPALRDLYLSYYISKGFVSFVKYIFEPSLFQKIYRKLIKFIS